MDASNMAKNTMARSIVGGVATAAISLVVSLIVWAVAHVLGFPTGPDDVKNICLYGFVVGCLVWALRTTSWLAALVSGGISTVVIMLVMTYLISISPVAEARDRSHDLVPVILLYGGVPAIASYISAYLCAWYMPDPNKKVIQSPTITKNVISRPR